MSNKVEIKRELLIKTALKMIEKEGIANFSVRKLTEADVYKRQAMQRSTFGIRFEEEKMYYATTYSCLLYTSHKLKPFVYP